MKRPFILILAVLLWSVTLNAAKRVANTLSSPDGNIVVNIYPQGDKSNPTLAYRLMYCGERLTDMAHISLSVQPVCAPSKGTTPSYVPTIHWNGGQPLRTETRLYDSVVHPVVGKNASIRDCYNELTLFYKDYHVIFRAYNEGFAYRFVADASVTSAGETIDSLIVPDEQAEFPLCGNPSVIFGETNNLTAWELSNKVYQHISDIDTGRYAITPTVFTHCGKGHTSVVVAESDLHLYPGMYLKKQSEGLSGYWAQSPKKVVMGSWGNFVTVVAEREQNLATVPSTHAFPWRIYMPTHDDKSLLNNELIYLLAEPCRIEDLSWIRPGKATWEWWHCAILPDAPFPNGNKHRTTELYKYYIDFAAENNIEYLLVDAGWNNLFRPTELNKNIGMHEVIRYGKERNVGVWLWMVASTLMHEPHHYLDTLASWGAIGTKIDFFDRDDDEVMYWYDELARACAERHLMVDFHGCSKPTGLNRTYPNILNFEAIRGEECCKWDTSTNPNYRMQYLYGRQLAGPMDYTPGAMRNCFPENFQPIDPGLPSGLGTRCQELALYILLDDYFAMLADSPDAYRHDSTILKFLQSVPVTWDETRPLQGKIGESAVVAKRKGDKWFVGGACGWTPQTASYREDFLDAGKTYTLQLYTDVTADTLDATQYHYEVLTTQSTHQRHIRMHRGGGLVAIYTPVK